MWTYFKQEVIFCFIILRSFSTKLSLIVQTCICEKTTGLGGQFREISVALQYLFQGFNIRGDGKYKDLTMDTGTEELAHMEMIATMIARLLEGAPDLELEDAAKDPIIAAILGGSNPQHAIVSGLGAMPADSNGYPWNAKYHYKW